MYGKIYNYNRNLFYNNTPNQTEWWNFVGDVSGILWISNYSFSSFIHLYEEKATLGIFWIKWNVLKTLDLLLSYLDSQ